MMDNHDRLRVRLAFPMVRRFAGGVRQGRCHARPVEEDMGLTRCGRYIERDPVRCGRAGFARDYRFGSAGFYALGERDAMTDVDPQFEPGGLGARERAAYSAMLQDTGDAAWMREPTGLAIGSAGFAARWAQAGGRPRRRQGWPVEGSGRVSL
jgi:hypothetical protein